MDSSSRKSASASAAACMKPGPRWLTSMTDMPPCCQSSSSRCACSNTSSGNMAGPGEKLNARILKKGSGAGGRLVRTLVRRRVGLRFVGLRLVRRCFRVYTFRVPVFGQSVDALQPRELIALFQTDEAHALGVAADHGNVLHRRSHQHAVLAHEHYFI